MPEAEVGRAFGLHKSLDQAGAIIGPLLGFALFPFVGSAAVFYLSLLPCAMAVVILMFFVNGKLAPPGIKRPVAGNVKDVTAEKRFIALLRIMGLFSAGAF